MMEDSGGQESFLSQSALQIFQNELQVVNCPLLNKNLFFLIFGLQIFFQNIKVGGGKKIKFTKIFFLFNLKHIWIGEK